MVLHLSTIRTLEDKIVQVCMSLSVCWHAVISHVSIQLNFSRRDGLGHVVLAWLQSERLVRVLLIFGIFCLFFNASVVVEGMVLCCMCGLVLYF